MSRIVRIGLLGAGNRGRDVYGRWTLQHPDRARIVAVAERRPDRRDAVAVEMDIDPQHRFDDWSALVADAPRLNLDAVIVALPDHDHVEPALAAAGHGLAILLEKPAATTPGDLDRLSAAARGLDARIFVGHVLRYTPFWRTLHQIVTSGAMGRLLTIRHEENIGFWHFAHSYVRGNWRRSDGSSPMVLAKTCHDLDLIRWFAGAPPTTVSSVGSLSFFREDSAPDGAPARCLDGCPAAADCAFYAPRYYVEALADTDGWPVSVLTTDPSRAGRLHALETGPYGRCVFHCDNDVVDHQQTVLSFPTGLTATLSTSGLTGENTRVVQMTGTAGEVTGHMESGDIVVDQFSPTASLPDLPLARIRSVGSRGPLRHRVTDMSATPPADGDAAVPGHGGGDDALMSAFVAAVADGTLGTDHGASLESALDSHRMAFAAEDSRTTGRTVTPAWPTT